MHIYNNQKQMTVIMKISKGADASNRVLVITRRFNAPRELVFDAFTQPASVKQWMLGPPGHSMPICEIDLRVGGLWRYVWRLEDESDGTLVAMTIFYSSTAARDAAQDSPMEDGMEGSFQALDSHLEQDVTI